MANHINYTTQVQIILSSDKDRTRSHGRHEHIIEKCSAVACEYCLSWVPLFESR